MPASTATRRERELTLELDDANKARRKAEDEVDRLRHQLALAKANEAKSVNTSGRAVGRYQALEKAMKVQALRRLLRGGDAHACRRALHAWSRCTPERPEQGLQKVRLTTASTTTADLQPPVASAPALVWETRSRHAGCQTVDPPRGHAGSQASISTPVADGGTQTVLQHGDVSRLLQDSFFVSQHAAVVSSVAFDASDAADSVGEVLGDLQQALMATARERVEVADQLRQQRASAAAARSAHLAALAALRVRVDGLVNDFSRSIGDMRSTEGSTSFAAYRMLHGLGEGLDHLRDAIVASEEDTGAQGLRADSPAESIATSLGPSRAAALDDRTSFARAEAEAARAETDAWRARAVDLEALLDKATGSMVHAEEAMVAADIRLQCGALWMAEHTLAAAIRALVANAPYQGPSERPQTLDVEVQTPFTGWEPTDMALPFSHLADEGTDEDPVHQPATAASLLVLQHEVATLDGELRGARGGRAAALDRAESHRLEAERLRSDLAKAKGALHKAAMRSAAVARARSLAETRATSAEASTARLETELGQLRARRAQHAGHGPRRLSLAARQSRSATAAIESTVDVRVLSAALADADAALVFGDKKLARLAHDVTSLRARRQSAASLAGSRTSMAMRARGAVLGVVLAARRRLSLQRSVERWRAGALHGAAKLTAALADVQHFAWRAEVAEAKMDVERDHTGEHGGAGSRTEESLRSTRGDETAEPAIEALVAAMCESERNISSLTAALAASRAHTKGLEAALSEARDVLVPALTARAEQSRISAREAEAERTALCQVLESLEVRATTPADAPPPAVLASR